MNRSPFPGMDPYLEAFWRSVHHTLVTYAAESLQPQLPDDLVARVEERVYISDEDRLLGIRYPDVKVRQPFAESSGRQPGVAETSLAVAEPIVPEYNAEPITEGYLEVRDLTAGGRVVTAIEFLSPTNKARGAGAKEYTDKQRTDSEAGVNLVEIDLTREGDRELALPLERIPADLHATYLVCIRRGDHPKQMEILPIPLAERLPNIGVPLRSSDADVALDLQGLIDRVYKIGRYERDIDYAQPPRPALNAAEAEWAAATIATNRGT